MHALTADMRIGNNLRIPAVMLAEALRRLLASDEAATVLESEVSDDTWQDWNAPRVLCAIGTRVAVLHRSHTLSLSLSLSLNTLSPLSLSSLRTRVVRSMI